jgi:DNA-binding NarL/FixJ family response regulator
MPFYREKILYVDEEELFCEGLLRHFKSKNSFEVVDVARDWPEALSKTEKLAPDIVVLNLHVLHSDWIDTCKSIRQRQPSTTIIVVAESSENSKEALKAGVNALVAKELPFRDILRIIGSTTERSALVFLNGGTQEHVKPVLSAADGLRLSKRERELLVLLAKGLQNKEIANRLSISVPTVNNHLYNMFRKLGCSNRTEAVYAAMKKGLIDMEN